MSGQEPDQILRYPASEVGLINAQMAEKLPEPLLEADSRFGGHFLPGNFASFE